MKIYVFLMLLTIPCFASLKIGNAKLHKVVDRSKGDQVSRISLSFKWLFGDNPKKDMLDTLEEMKKVEVFLLTKSGKKAVNLELDNLTGTVSVGGATYSSISIDIPEIKGWAMFVASYEGKSVVVPITKASSVELTQNEKLKKNGQARP